MCFLQNIERLSMSQKVLVLILYANERQSIFMQMNARAFYLFIKVSMAVLKSLMNGVITSILSL